MIILEAGVEIEELTPTIGHAWQVANEIMGKFNKELRVTSCGKDTCDIRTSNLSESQAERALDLLSNALGKEYDIAKLNNEACVIKFLP